MRKYKLEGIFFTKENVRREGANCEKIVGEGEGDGWGRRLLAYERYLNSRFVYFRWLSELSLTRKVTKDQEG